MLERGERVPTAATVELLAAALGVSADESTALLAASRRVVFLPSVEADGRDSAQPPPTPDAVGDGHASEVTAASPQSLTRSAVLPSGTVTFLFTDIEGSTRLLQQLGSERYAALQAEHHRLVRAACVAHGGREVDTQGDAFFVVFPAAPGALAAAAEAQRVLASHAWPDGTPIQVRIGLHTGTPLVTPDGEYVGLDINRAARIAAAGHGGQVLLSAATRLLTEQTLPEGAALRDLGAHRLKDLQHPEHLSQLVLPDLPADFPPLKSLDRHAHNLPIQPTVLLGREEAVAAVCALLHREDVRLVTLTGPGGVGKTRLGLQAAAELAAAFLDGVWFVRLSRLSDPALVLPTIAQTLGLREAGSLPIAALLHEYVRTRHLLLLLDNFEQVMGAAAGMAELLATSPSLKVLVTSRVTLRLQGEREYSVPPLTLLAEHRAESPAVALFVQRAQASRPDFMLSDGTAPVVAAICAKLDGLPLAIELVATRVKLLPPAALLQRLERTLPLLTGGARDLEARQQTMRNTLAWSEDLLQPKERRLFWRLAVFVGGFTLEAAEAVCATPAGAEPLGVAVVDGLAALVDQSLVQRWSVGQDGAEDGAKDEEREGGGEEHFRQLYVVREYALEQLEASGEAEVLRRAHAGYFRDMAEQAEPDLRGPKQAAWMLLVDRDIGNVRAALDWAREHREAELGLRLAANLWSFWGNRGYLSEGHRWLEELLALDAARQEGTSLPTWLRARAMTVAGHLTLGQGDYGRAAAYLETGISLGREAGDWFTLAGGQYFMGNLMRAEGYLERAVACYEEMLTIGRARGETRFIYYALQGLADIACDRSDWDEATARYQESLALARAAGHQDGVASCLTGLGWVALRQHNEGRAAALLREAVALYRASGELYPLACVLEWLAVVFATTDQEHRAARLLGAAAMQREAIGTTPLMAYSPTERAHIEATIASARAALGEAGWAAAFAAGQALTLEEAIAEALDATA
jgi:predicted ATPase/class 3 adenylate cyclase